MTPIRIYAKNFGAIPEIDLDVSGIFLCCVVGKNGASKSTLFTHLFNYAFFGKPRSNCSIDDMVRVGTQEMLVQLDFEHNNEVYQVTRTRSLKGRGKSTCEFQKLLPDGNWEKLTAPTKIADTNKIIETLLNLDSDTFLASSMIMQNDSANFTAKLPGERKQVLTQILGLDLYAELQDKAKTKYKALELKLEANKVKLADLEEKIEGLPAIEADLQLAKNNITYVTCDIREKETELSDLQGEIKTLETRQDKANSVQKEIDNLVQDMGDRQKEIAVLEAQIFEAQKILKNEALITAKITELEEINVQIPALKAKESRLTELKMENVQLLDEIDKLSDEEHSIAKKIIDINRDLALKEELQKATERYQQVTEELKGYDQKAEQYQALQNQINTADTNLLRQSTDLDKLINEYNQLDKKVSILQDSNCIDPENARCKFLIDAQEAKEKIPEIQKQIEEAREGLGPLYEAKQNLIAEQEALDYDSAHHADIKKQSQSLQKQAEEFNTLQGKEELLQNLTEQRQRLADRIDTLNEKESNLNSDIKTLQQETEKLPILKARIPSLQDYVTQKDNLPEAKITVKTARESIAKLEAEIKAKSEQREKLLKEYLDMMEGLTDSLSQAQRQAQETQGSLKEMQTDLNSLYSQKGSLESKLFDLQNNEQEYKKLKAELAPTAKELTRWETLIKAFGKNGIPVLIVENSIPELQRISNDILSQMTNGENSLRFDTQRDKKSGDGQVETLDIWVNDSAGYERIYETFSGGEKLRIDLALRLGLAELLANRAGSKIEFICADEIFGSQDTEHTELVINAIKSIAPRFKKVFVITHIETAQGLFPQQISLERTDSGIEVRVA